MQEREPPTPKGEAEEQPRSPERESDAACPLSVSQLGIWSAQSQDPGWALNLARHYAIDGAVDPNLFAQACRQLVAEFDLYRVAFSETPDGPRQKVRDALSWSPVIRDFRGESDPEFAANFWMRNDLTEPVGTIGEHLFTLALLQVADNRWLFYHRCHRLICDEPSLAMATSRLAALYGGFASGEPLQFAPQTSALTLVTAELDYRASNAFTRDRNFWSKQLTQPVEPVSLTGKSLRRATVPPICYSLELRRSLVDNLQTLAHAHGASLSDVLSVAVAIYLHRLSGAAAISVTRPVPAGRAPNATPRAWRQQCCHYD
jgi:hypothetical protein